MILLLFDIGMITGGYSADLLVTNIGKYSSDDSKTSVEITSPAVGHLNVQMAFKIQMKVPGFGRDVEVTDSRRIQNLPVKSGWAYCISTAGDVWFYDGGGAFTVFRRKPDHVETLKSCSEPNLGDRAPEVMKRWVATEIAQPSTKSQRTTARGQSHISACFHGP